jgi:MFS family permease
MRRLSSPRANPTRTLEISTLVDTLGKGVWLSAGIVALTRGNGLSAHAVGFGLTLAGALALGSGILVGRWSDRVGARRMLVGTLLLEALSTAGLAVARSVPLFLVAATLAAVGAQGSTTARSALIAALGGPGGRVALRARLRSLTNLGITAGALLGGLGLVLDDRVAYAALLLADALTFVAAAALIINLPEARPAPGARGTAVRSALRDGRYLAVTALAGVQALNYSLLTVGMPLWVTQRTSAPSWVIAPLLMLNTVIVVTCQVRVSRSMPDPWSAARGLRRAGGAFAIGFTAMGLAGGPAPAAAVALMVGAVGLHTVGELWTAGAGFELSFSLADPAAQGEYQGVFGLSQGVASSLGPALATSLCLTLGAIGWVALGALLLVVGLVAPPTVRWAERGREPQPDGDMVLACETV